MTDLLTLLAVFGYLSLLTVGGGMAAFPAMHALTVDTHHWLTFPQLVHLYSIGQLAPGPNMMMVVPIGEWVAGIPGGLAVLVAFFGPTALLTFLVGRAWQGLRDWPWREAIQRGLAPVSIGLLLAGCLTMAQGAILDRETAAIAAAVLLIHQARKVNPALLVLAGAAAGLASFV